MGNGSVISPGGVQRMSAGTGVRHSEFNHSATDPVHLLQIWILPERTGIPPSYEQTTFSREDRRGRLRLIASPDGREGSVTINQSARVYAAILASGDTVEHVLHPGRHGWVQVAQGGVTVNGQALGPGDGAAIEGERALTLAAHEPHGGPGIRPAVGGRKAAQLPDAARRPRGLSHPPGPGVV